MRLRVLCLSYGVLPVAFWPGSTSYDAVKLTVLALGGALLIAIWARDRGGRSVRPWRPTWLAVLGAALLAAGLLGLPGAANRLLVLQALLLVACWLVLAGATAAAIAGRDELRRLLAWLAGGAALAALYGLSQMAGLLPGAPADSGMLAGISSLGNQNYLAGLLAVVLYPALALARAPAPASARAGTATPARAAAPRRPRPGLRRRQRAVAAVAVALMLAGLAAGRAAGPLLAVAVAGLALLPAWHLAARRPGLVPVVHLALLLGLLGAAALAWPVATRLPPGATGVAEPPTAMAGAAGGARTAVAGGVGAADVAAGPDPGPPRPLLRRLYNRNSGDERLTAWAVALAMVERRPLVGVGLGNFKVAWPERRAALGRAPGAAERSWLVAMPRVTRAHNEFLQLAAEAGLVGLGLVAAAGLLAAWRWRRAFLALDAFARRDQLLMLAGLNVAAVHALLSFPAHLPATAAALALPAGALASRYLAAAPLAAVRLPAGRPVAAAALLAAAGLAAGALHEFRADLRQRRALDLWAAGRLVEARPLLADAVSARLWPGTGLVHAGVAEVVLGDPRRAEELLRASLRTEPTPEALLQLAELLRDRGAGAEALALLDRLDAAHPGERWRLDSSYVRATALLRLGDLATAEARLRGLVAAAPGHHRAWLALGYLAALAGDEAEAAARYRRALGLIERKLADLAGPQEPGEAAGRRQARRMQLARHRQAALAALRSLKTAGPGGGPPGERSAVPPGG